VEYNGAKGGKNTGTDEKTDVQMYVGGI